jgi:predicted dehydrogenase
MLKVGVIGLGKMGISHLSIINAHPDVEFVAVCDTSNLVLSAIKKYSDLHCFTDFKNLIDQSKPDCLFVAVPTKYHSEIVKYALLRDVHVFCEKPFCLNLDEGTELVELAERKGIVNQVGYHNRFIGTFNETKRLLENNIIGEVYHVLGEAYGPVVLKPKGSTWRSDKKEGGGCLNDYASHVINLMNYYVGSPQIVSGTIVKSIFSKSVDDAVYSSLFYEGGLTGQISVNWSDETYRKMSTQITILGKEGKIIVDAQELRVFLKRQPVINGFKKGWNIKYITDLTSDVNFYLRGEEYSAQVDYFFKCIQGQITDNKNSFKSALETDKIIARLALDSEGEEEKWKESYSGTTSFLQSIIYRMKKLVNRR